MRGKEEEEARLAHEHGAASKWVRGGERSLLRQARVKNEACTAGHKCERTLGASRVLN